MTQPPAALTRLLSRFLCIGGLLGVAILTLIDRGATRAYSTPWIYLFWFAQLAPLLALALRAVPHPRALQLPDRAWLWLVAISASALLAAALLSPYRAPSLLATLTPLAALAAFLLFHDSLQQHGERAINAAVRWIGVAVVAILTVSVGHWLIALFQSHLLARPGQWLALRNESPLGHSNYTAGLALLTLPWSGYLAWRAIRAAARMGWLAATVLALVMLFSSGSRGGLIGAVVLAATALCLARVNWKVLLLLCLTGLAALVALAYAHPRLRAMILNPRAWSLRSNESNIQRTAMATAGWRMGEQRPVLGWGTGTTPLVYPRFRSGLDGGVEDALQLHSTPVQIWADLGATGLACLLAFAGVVWRDRRPSTKPFAAAPRAIVTPAFITVAGYAAFAFTDYQLDVPVFALVTAACAAVIARTSAASASRRLQTGIGASTVVILLLVGLLGHRDPTPELNLRALDLARDPARQTEARALFERSLALNPDQEIAHFNLGWLLVVTDPAAADSHFNAAAHLVPDKGGVYFGLALARLNQDRPAQISGVVHALALECLNDPAFLISPWWRQPNLAALRPATMVELHRLAKRVAAQLSARKDQRHRDAEYIPVLADWLVGRSGPGQILRHAFTSARVSYFAARPSVPEWSTAPSKVYHRERPGYPVLMRNLDLPTPVDLFEVQENSLASGDLAELFPKKGWLPAPLLVGALDGEAKSAGLFDPNAKTRRFGKLFNR